MKRHRTQSQERSTRRGATLCEAVIVLSTFLILIFGMLDLGIGVLHYNTVAEAARTGARNTIVHGAKAPAGAFYGSVPGGTWSDSTAATNVKDIVTPLLNAEGIPTDSITVTVVHADGPDRSPKDTGTSDPGDSVTVTVTVPYTPIFAFIFGTTTITLTGKCSMVIAH